MSTLKVNTITDVAGTGSPGIRGNAAVLVKYSGVTNVIAASHNVSSITDNGTGDQTVNFITSFANVNFIYTYGRYYGGIPEALMFVRAATTGSIRLITGYTYASPAYADSGEICVACFA